MLSLAGEFVLHSIDDILHKLYNDSIEQIRKQVDLWQMYQLEWMII